MGIQRFRSQKHYPSGRFPDGEYKIWVNGVKVLDNPLTMAYLHQASKYERNCVDALHARRGGKYIEGGGLAISGYEHYASAHPVSVDYYAGAYHRHASGTLVAQYVGSSNLPTFVVPTDAFGDVSSYGPSAWKKFLPGMPQAGVSTFLAELREAPTMVRFLRERSTNSLGGNFLNHQFGWTPFLSDIRKMVQLHGKTDSILSNLATNNGKWMQRGGSVAESENVEYDWEKHGLTAHGFTPALDSYLYAPGNPHWAKGSVSFLRRVWFSGRFKYWIDPMVINTPVFRRNFLRKLYGLSITPREVWELIPWSWLVDWFTNAGDVISNVSGGALDCVAKYAYVMGTTSRRWTQQCGTTFCDGTSITGNVETEHFAKTRVAANPYGFGITFGELSPRQLAILAALGLTRR
jgi:hypothetical protein